MHDRPRRPPRPACPAEKPRLRMVVTPETPRRRPASQEGARVMTPEPRPHVPTHPMQHGHRPAASGQYPSTLVPEAGWHFLHAFYQVDRAALAGLPQAVREEGRAQILQTLDRSADGAPDPVQCF